MNTFENYFVRSVISHQTGDDSRSFLYLGLQYFDRTANSSEIERSASSILQERGTDVKGRRYRFGSNTATQTARDRALDICFQNRYAAQPEVLIDWAQMIDPNAAPRYPIWKRVFLISLPKRASELLSSYWIKITCSIFVADKIKKLLESAYRANQAMIGSKIVPFVINHTPIQAIRLGNRIMDGVDLILNNKFRLVSYLFLSQFVCSIAANAFKNAQATPAERQRLRGQFGIIEQWGVTPDGLPRPLDLVFRIVNFVSFKFVRNFVFFAPVCTVNYLNERRQEFQEFLSARGKDLASLVSQIEKNYARERCAAAKKKTYAMWKGLTEKYKPGAPELSQNSTRPFGERCVRALSKFETPLVENITALIEAVLLHVLLKKWPSGDTYNNIFKLVVLHNLAGRLWEMRGNEYNKQRFEHIRNEEGYVPAAFAKITTEAVSILARGLFLYSILGHFKSIKPSPAAK